MSAFWYVWIVWLRNLKKNSWWLGICKSNKVGRTMIILHICAAWGANSRKERCKGEGMWAQLWFIRWKEDAGVQSAGFLVHVALMAAHPACTFDPPQAPFAIVHPETPSPLPPWQLQHSFRTDAVRGRWWWWIKYQKPVAVPAQGVFAAAVSFWGEIASLIM